MILEKKKEVQYVSYRVGHNEKLEDVLKKFSVGVFNVVFENEDLSEGDIVLIKLLNAKIHIVKPAETLESIARQYCVSVEELCEKNQIKAVFVGQQIII